MASIILIIKTIGFYDMLFFAGHVRLTTSDHRVFRLRYVNDRFLRATTRFSSQESRFDSPNAYSCHAHLQTSKCIPLSHVVTMHLPYLFKKGVFALWISTRLALPDLVKEIMNIFE